MNSILLVNANILYIPLADKTVSCIVTSPPYWALRDYAIANWQGGDPACDHVEKQRSLESGLRNDGRKHKGLYEGEKAAKIAMTYRAVCGKCGAHRVDNQLGLEKDHDCLGWATGADCGECYICHCRQWAAECWRVLRDDGTMWVNIGDSYAGSGKHANPKGLQSTNRGTVLYNNVQRSYIPPGIKRKDLAGIPYRFALALQADGWYLRSDIIWHK